MIPMIKEGQGNILISLQIFSFGYFFFFKDHFYFTIFFLVHAQITMVVASIYVSHLDFKVFVVNVRLAIQN